MSEIDPKAAAMLEAIRAHQRSGTANAQHRERLRNIRTTCAKELRRLKTFGILGYTVISLLILVYFLVKRTS